MPIKAAGQVKAMMSQLFKGPALCCINSELFLGAAEVLEGTALHIGFGRDFLMLGCVGDG